MANNWFLREARMLVGMTEQQVAEHMRVTQVTVNRWETGTRSPSFLNVWALSRLFGCPMEAFKDGAAFARWASTRKC